MAYSVSSCAKRGFRSRNAFIWWKQYSHVLNCGEYGGWNISSTPQSLNISVRRGSTKWPWWNPQLSITTESPLSSTAEPSTLVKFTASSKIEVVLVRWKDLLRHWYGLFPTEHVADLLYKLHLMRSVELLLLVHQKVSCHIFCCLSFWSRYSRQNNGQYQGVSR